jgi:hypothetical protein
MPPLQLLSGKILVKILSEAKRLEILLLNLMSQHNLALSKRKIP